MRPTPHNASAHSPWRSDARRSLPAFPAVLMAPTYPREPPSIRDFRLIRASAQGEAGRRCPTSRTAPDFCSYPEEAPTDRREMTPCGLCHMSARPPDVKPRKARYGLPRTFVDGRSGRGRPWEPRPHRTLRRVRSDALHRVGGCFRVDVAPDLRSLRLSTDPPSLQVLSSHRDATAAERDDQRSDDHG